MPCTLCQILIEIREQESNNKYIMCFFRFDNPISKEKLLLIELKGENECAMEFVKRIKEYIKTDLFKVKIKDKIIADCEMKKSHLKHNEDLKRIRQELDGMKFSLKVDLD